MKKKKKKRLKRWVRVAIKVIVTLIILGILAIFIGKIISNYNDLATQCDLEKGYTCSHYEISQYRR